MKRVPRAASASRFGVATTGVRGAQDLRVVLVGHDDEEVLGGECQGLILPCRRDTSCHDTIVVNAVRRGARRRAALPRIAGDA